MAGSDIATVHPPASPQPRLGTGWKARLVRVVRPRRRWCLGTRLMVAATVGWLLLVVAHRLLSGRTPLWAPFDLLPPITFVAVPLLLAAVAPAARPVRWRLLAALAVSVLLAGGATGVVLSALWYSPPAAPATGAITVVAWNTEFWDQNLTDGKTVRTDRDFYDYLHGFNADVYLLSEYLHTTGGFLSGKSWTADMAARVDALPQLRQVFPGYDIAVSGEQITLSRLPIVAQHGIDVRPWLPGRYRAVPEALRDWPEGYTVETLRTDVRVGGRVVSFYNGQINQPPTDWWVLSATARDANHYRFVRREASLRALGDDVARNPNPVVFAGDLNTSPTMGVRRLLPDRLVDASRALSSVYPATWRMGSFELWRLDWLLTTPDVVAHRYELRDCGGRSDHRLQRMVLSLKK